MKDKYAELRTALDAVPCIKWTASRATVHIPETEDWAGKDLSITGLDKQVARKLARYIADTNPAAIRALLAERDALREALRWAAGTLQSACCLAGPISEESPFKLGDETRTVAQICNAADAALAQEHEES